MKKILLVIGIIIILVGIAGFAYWYWQNQTGTSDLQTVALDNPSIDSFDDVCTKKTDYESECTGNIAEFGCDQYPILSDVTTSGLEPLYPILKCEKKDQPGGVYTIEGTGWSFGISTAVDYIIIKNNSFQLIESEDQFRKLFLPVESVEEAKAYFNVLGRGLLIFNEAGLSRIQSPNFLGDKTGGYRFLVPVDSIDFSQITETVDGYVITAYSGIPADCTDEVYLYTFLLTRDGQLTEQSKQLIWESEVKPSCVY